MANGKSHGVLSSWRNVWTALQRFKKEVIFDGPVTFNSPVSLQARSLELGSVFAVSGQELLMDTTAGVATVTLPTIAVAGDGVRIRDAKSLFGTNKVILDPGAVKINGSSGTKDLDQDGMSVDAIYIDTATGWQLFNIS